MLSHLKSYPGRVLAVLPAMSALLAKLSALEAKTKAAALAATEMAAQKDRPIRKRRLA